MANERKDYTELSENSQDAAERIPFQVEADMRKGPPSSAVIRMHGDIGDEQNRLLEKVIDPLDKAAVKYVVVDCSDVRKITPEPIKLLIDFATGRKEKGMQYPCALTGLRRTVVEKIKAAKPGKVFIVYKYFRDAVKALKLSGLPDLYVAGTRPSGLNMRVMVKVVPIGGRAALVTPYGYIQQPEADLLGKILRRVSLMEVKNVVIDMTGISYANSHALGSLLNCSSAWQRVYGRKAVALAGAKAGIKLALTTLGIARSTFICDTINEALAELEAEEKRVAEKPKEPEKKEPEPIPEEAVLTEKPEAAEVEKKPEKEEIEELYEEPEISLQGEEAPVEMLDQIATKTQEEVAAENLYEQIESASENEEGAEEARKEAEHVLEERHEETAFSILADKESSSTDAWILKNVQSILKKTKKK